MGKYREWLSTLVETRKSATTVGAWVVTSGTVFLILFLAAYVEPIRSWFRLDFRPAVFCFLPMMGLGLVAGTAESRGRLSLLAFGTLVLCGATLFQFFWCALVVLSRPPGSLVMASLALLTMTFHGYLHRVTLRYPYGVVGSLLALGAAALLRPQSPSQPLLYFVGPTGILLSLITGGVGLRIHHNVVQGDKLKQALYYRILNEKMREHGEMSRRVLDLLKYNHDAANTLSAIFVHAQLLEEAIANEHGPIAQRLSTPVSTLLTQLSRLKTLLGRAHRVADEIPTVETVELLDVVASVARECAAVFPSVAIEISKQEDVRGLTVKLHDGEVGLRRIVENILRNACEGNGTFGARRVQIAIATADREVLLSFVDDGPGFSTDLLTSEPEAMATTKKTGHGLGLFSAHEIVKASGGTLLRRNAAAGGAIVDLQLLRGVEVI
jgi:signal transduction histidine kinase